MLVPNPAQALNILCCRCDTLKQTMVPKLRLLDNSVAKDVGKVVEIMELDNVAVH